MKTEEGAADSSPAPRTGGVAPPTSNPPRGVAPSADSGAALPASANIGIGLGIAHFYGKKQKLEGPRVGEAGEKSREGAAVEGLRITDEQQATERRKTERRVREGFRLLFPGKRCDRWLFYVILRNYSMSTDCKCKRLQRCCAEWPNACN